MNYRNSIALSLFLIASIVSIAPQIGDRAMSQSPSFERTSNNKEQNFIKEELYFGLGEPGEATISETQWQLFLQRVITPRFKEGLTVLDAYGQYLNHSQQLIRENTKLVILIRENNPTKERLIQEIIDIYKQTFRQESVLRVTSSVQASF
jgi:hypothetical protein